VLLQTHFLIAATTQKEIKLKHERGKITAKFAPVDLLIFE
jgi:hypothetical protein